jgi:hypothetical protein
MQERILMSGIHFPIKCKDTGEVCYTYQSYLSSEHWRNFKIRWLNSNDYKKHKLKHGLSGCACCTRWGEMHFHHITYQRLGRENPRDVIRVCKECHELIHDYIKKAILKVTLQGRFEFKANNIMKNKSWTDVRGKQMKKYGQVARKK